MPNNDILKTRPSAILANTQADRMVERCPYAIRKKAGIEDVTIHDLRRSLGAALASASANVDVALIKGSLNHRDLKTTMKHYAFSNKDAERAVKQRVHKKWMDGKSKRAKGTESG